MDDDDIVKEFLVESHENLDQVDSDLVALEADPANTELLASIFRTMHTIKGTCGFLGFSTLERVTHAGENLLGQLRDGERVLDDDITAALLTLVDAVRQILASIESGGDEGDDGHDKLIDTLAQLFDAPVAEVIEDPSATTTVAVPAGDGLEATAFLTPPEDSESLIEMTAEQLAPPPESAAQPEVAPPETTLAPETDSPEETAPPDSINSRWEAFLIESYARADQLDEDLVALEQDSGNPETVGRVIGIVQGLEAACEVMELVATRSALRSGLKLLSRLKEGAHTWTPDVATAMLTLVDLFRQSLVEIETTGSDRTMDFMPLLQTFDRIEEESAAALLSPPTVVDATAAMTEIPEATDATSAPESAEVTTPDRQSVEPVSQPAKESEAQPAASPAQPADRKPGPAKPEQVEAPATRAASVADTSIRVDVGILDQLMDQVGELVLARNRILGFATLQQDHQLSAAYQQLDLITSELQEGVMKTRLQPIGTIWNKFPRLVRDLARECGKRVTLHMEGEETELDRSLIEAIRDPLTHLVRNAIDHGIEPAARRASAGKPEDGNLTLRAFHEGGQVHIEIVDDGGGIDPARIARSAQEKGLLVAGQADLMSEAEILDLIFAPGFSTAESVTNVSGRGVGMDVVRNNMEKINGSIEIKSRVGVGTTVKIMIPLTLAIIPALLVRCDGERYALPQASLLELVRLDPEDRSEDRRIEWIRNAPVYRLRGKLLPLVFLDELLKLRPDAESTRRDTDSICTIVVLQAERRQFGLVVEQVLDTEEIVVKPLGEQLKNVGVYSGATIMGDGNVALILDAVGVAEHARVLSDVMDANAIRRSEDSGFIEVPHYQSLLLVESCDGQQMAFPLSQIRRLQKLSPGDWQLSGDTRVIEYDGQVMPLIHVDQCLSREAPAHANEEQELSIVVLSADDRNVGVIVDRILDTVAGDFELERYANRPGVIGSVIIGGRVTEWLDVDEMIRQAGGSLPTGPGDSEADA